MNDKGNSNLHARQTRDNAVCVCVRIMFLSFFFVCGTHGLKGDFDRLTAPCDVSFCLDRRDNLAFSRGPGCGGVSVATGPQRRATVGRWCCCFDDLGSAAPGGENAD